MIINRTEDNSNDTGEQRETFKLAGKSFRDHLSPEDQRELDRLMELARAACSAELAEAQAHIRNAQKSITMHEGRILDFGTSDDLWFMLQSANNNLQEVHANG